MKQNFQMRAIIADITQSPAETFRYGHSGKHTAGAIIMNRYSCRFPAIYRISKVIRFRINLKNLPSPSPVGIYSGFERTRESANLGTASLAKPYRYRSFPGIVKKFLFRELFFNFQFCF